MFLTISAVFILFLQTVNVSVVDIFRIPELVEHYSEHQSEYGDSLLSFISKHYGLEKNAHQSEDPAHEDLPFHHTIQISSDIQLLPSIGYDLSSDVVESDCHCFQYVSSASRLGEHKINHPPQVFC